MKKVYPVVQFEYLDKKSILEDPTILRPVLWALDVFGKFEGLSIDEAVEEIVDRASYADIPKDDKFSLTIYSWNLIKWTKFLWRLKRYGGKKLVVYSDGRVLIREA